MISFSGRSLTSTQIEAFAQFGSDLDTVTQHKINRGSRLIELLKQNQFVPLSVEKQVVIIYAGMHGYLDKIAVQNIVKFEQTLLELLNSKYQPLLQKLKINGKITKEIDLELKELFKTNF
jgi:F0F1-type ATP synthase alpha subunit